MEGLGASLRGTLEPLLQEIESLTARIKGWDHKIEQIAREYPECELLQQVSGVGTLIALTFVLTVEDPHRFAKEREVAMWVCGPSAVIPVMVACEFFVVITAAFRTFYVLVIMEIGSRQILHQNVTAHPTAEWTLQQSSLPLPHSRSG